MADEADSRFVTLTGDDAPRLVREAGLPVGTPVIVVCGGADDLTGGALAAAEAVVGDAVARAAATTGAVVVDGGTDTGVMRLVGQARREQPAAIPALVGVAPAGRVVAPGDEGGDRAALEPNHTHFVLADSDAWGGETELLFGVAAEIAGGARGAVVLAGGGGVAKTEVLQAVRRGWTVFAVEGTGGVADQVAALWRKHRTRRRRRGAALLPHRLKFQKQPPPSEIGDPAYRKIVTEGEVHPFSGDAAQLTRRIAWELTDAPSLKEAWRQFATYDGLARRMRTGFERFQRAILLLGILATLLALVDDAIGGGALHWAVVAAPVLVAVLIALANRRAAGERWVLLRAAAESVKGEIYRYRTATGVYAQDRLPDKDPATRPAVLVGRLDAIETALIQTEASGGPLSPYAGPLPPDMYGAARDDDGLSPLEADRYLKIRIGDQLTYYHGRIRGLDRRRNALQFVGVAAGGAGAILAAAGAEIWIGLTTALSGAALSYLGALQVDATIVSYNQAASRLAALQRTWSARRPRERDEAAFDELVSKSEEVLTTELGGWVQQMNTALEQLQAEQSKTGPGGTEPPGRSPPQAAASDGV